MAGVADCARAGNVHHPAASELISRDGRIFFITAGVLDWEKGDDVGSNDSEQRKKSEGDAFLRISYV